MTRGILEKNVTLVAGSRTSQLARAQTEQVIALLQAANAHYHFDLRLYSTRGDRELEAPLPAIGGKGLFTERLEQALRDGEIDFAVHSLKDLPVDDSDGLLLGAILGRFDASDVVVTRQGIPLSDLPPGSVIGTSSLRRQAQILAARPDLETRSIRGNVETRIRKVTDGEYDAVVLAAAGIARLGLSDAHIERLPFSFMLPAPGQGALAVQCREDDEKTRSALAEVEDAVLRASVTAERSFLAALGAGCSAPVAALATSAIRKGRSVVSLRGRVLAVDGRALVEVTGEDSDPESLGRKLAGQALERGAAGLVAGRTGRVLPLSGRRVVVTRAAEQSDELVSLLESRGATPLVVPCIRIVPADGSAQLDEAAENPGGFDWLLFSSSNAVRIFFAKLGSKNRSGRQELPRIAAVGRSTAAAVEAHGARTAFVPAEFTGKALGRELPIEPGTRVLAVGARDGTGDAERELEARGAKVTRVVAYSTEAVRMSAAEAAELEAGFDALVFASGSAAEAFAAAVSELPRVRKGLEAEGVCVCCIGPSTAAAARSAGLPVRLIAETHTMPGIVEALVDYYGAQMNGK